MGLATEVAEQQSTPLPLGELAKKIYADVVEKTPELANKDFSSVYRYFQTRRP